MQYIVLHVDCRMKDLSLKGNVNTPEGRDKKQIEEKRTKKIFLQLMSRWLTEGEDLVQTETILRVDLEDTDEFLKYATTTLHDALTGAPVKKHSIKISTMMLDTTNSKQNKKKPLNACLKQGTRRGPWTNGHLDRKATCNNNRSQIARLKSLLLRSLKQHKHNNYKYAN